MKTFLLSMAAFFMSVSAFAFEFDGIDLNATSTKVTRAISSKNYVYDNQRNCLKGMCQGREIYLSFNFDDVSQKNHVGQLIVSVPMAEADAFSVCAQLLNVVYHQVANDEQTITYQVSDDGTKLVLTKRPDGVALVYNTPYYQAPKKK